MKRFQYFFAFTLPVITLAALLWPETLAFAGVVYSFGIIPLLEVLLPPDPRNHDEAAEPSLLADRLYDAMLYAMVPIQWGLMFLLLFRVAFDSLSFLQITGMTLSMGMCCGILGINVAHELGHRTDRLSRLSARLLLFSSLYAHFTIEHNRGHHKWVATPRDPATARRGESVYRFWLRCIPGVFRSAWRLSCDDVRRRGGRVFGPGNEVLRLMLIQAALVIGIGIVFGPLALLSFLGAALNGILLLETVNYIEHYGLLRTETEPGRYERVRPEHSWNSDHVLGRIMLFELTRHADHHYSASRKYQILRHMPDSPQLPFGYPTALMLALLPPLWFRVIHPRLDERDIPPAPSALPSAAG